jgi:uncharacterized membrane protein
MNYLKIFPRVAVLVDDSASMSVDDGGVSRLDRVKTILGGETWRDLSAKMADYSFEYYTLGRKLIRVGREEIPNLKGREEESNISSALFELARKNPGAPLAGTILFTDGKESAETREMRIGAPVVAVGLGKGFRDVRISRFKAPDFAFVNKPIKIDLEVEATGYEEAASRVILRKDGRIVTTRKLVFKKGQKRRKLSLSLTPELVGQHEISVEVVPQPDEVLTGNNREEFVLPVERDKIRILMISGRPSWNYRFLRQALKSDGSIDLVSFIILRSPTDPVNVPQSQLSLIPFPANVLFTEELKNFDLVIFDNFSYRLSLPPSYMENIKQAVGEGGSFMMIGGDESFYEGGYDQTPIEDILPVVLDKRRSGYAQGRFPFKLTDQGGKHPVMRVSGESELRSAWDNLPLLSGINRTFSVKPDAVVLGVDGKGHSGSAQLPVVAVMKYGKGRTAALLSDGFWRWNFQAVGRDENNRLYLTMVKQLVRWLVKDPSLDQIKLWGDVVREGGGGRLRLHTMVYHEDFSPASDAVLDVNLTYPSGRTERLDYLPGSRPGEYLAEADTNEDGVYSFKVEARARGVLLGAGELKIEYSAALAELQDVAPDEKFLRSISESTGGKYIEAEEFSSLAAEIPSIFRREPELKLIERRVDPLFKAWYVFALITLLLSLEWFMRRRRGLV